MRKPIIYTRNMSQRWGQSVHKICTTCVSATGFYPQSALTVLGQVYNLSSYTGFNPMVIPTLIPASFSVFQSVKSEVMPTIHTTNKDSDKSKILKSFFLYNQLCKEQTT
jgi:hypothetical protein